MKLSRRAVQEAFDAGRISKTQLQALAANDSGPEAMRALEAVTTAGGAPPSEPMGAYLAEAKALALHPLRDRYACTVTPAPVEVVAELAAAGKQAPVPATAPAPTLWESVRELPAEPAQSKNEIGAERIEKAAAHLVESKNPVIRERAVKVAESAQGRRLYALTGNGTAQAVEVAGKPLIVRGASPREAEAIRAELEALTADGYGLVEHPDFAGAAVAVGHAEVW